ncbi:IS200/IS605 family transposase [Luteolibacter sp. GHJ8]|uniref:IS200/IS605 family transposase n=1 Tax=Luteolibacter rhizosphaerae TaxID=2989719 RepID=A0ABT3GB78_9BACT|nr:IS200/IS605 family transposase [Luteolibacter rhizosphaerae]MCW1917040.1 IS200/IS605 family transposase [Luteolibacter rhizosphaerae]
MPQSFSAVYLHVVFSTKSRAPYLADKELRTHLHRYLAGISQNLDCPTLLIGGVEDHVHLLARHSRTISQSDWIKELKRASSLWIKTDHPALRDFAWQSGYGVFSVSISQLDKVQAYIANQEEHHRKQSFQDEFRAMLKKHHIDWDEKYVWD